MHSEIELINRSRSGDLVAYNLLVTEYQSQVYNLVRCMAGHSADTDELTRQVFISGWERINGLKEEDFRLWILRLAAKLCLKAVDQKPRAKALHSPSFSVSFSSGYPNEFLTAQLMRLPPDQRLAVVLADILRLSYEEIVKITSWALKVITKHLSSGRTAFRDLLLEQGHYPLESGARAWVSILDNSR
ncbi:MAG: sigma factor [Dehalococcoidia bacterium]|nr:sigma factor [Dehalococcoidia bacterium]